MSAAAEFPWRSQDPGTELRLLFADAPLGLAECQRQGYITALNPALERLLGCDPRLARSLRLADLVPPEERAECERLLGELFAGKRESFQIASHTRSANSRPLRWTAWRVRGKNSRPDYALAIAEDATANEAAEQRLERAERLETVGRLTGGVAHDFNNLLTGVLLYCDLLLANLEEGHRARRYVEEIRDAGGQAAGLVRQLLSVTRPTQGEGAPVCLNQIVEGMRSLLERLIGENIELTFQPDPALGLIQVAAAQARQILLNLVLNARDAMPSGGKIRIETSNCRVQVIGGSAASEGASIPCALFVVEDNGAGMDAATCSHLFEALFSTKEAGRGTGLGLATVHDIVTGCGGLIHVESAEATGTRVTVILPLTGPPAFHFNRTAMERREPEGKFSMEAKMEAKEEEKE
jgi:two-component system, cell cycle sensor histidine kinase and response regulator CckA